MLAGRWFDDDNCLSILYPQGTPRFIPFGWRALHDKVYNKRRENIMYELVKPQKEI